jgi:co-chaperonin GroES (HSP10)
MCNCTQEHKEKTIPIVKKYDITFKCKDCGAIYFPLIVLRDLTVIWPIQELKENKLSSIIVIPEQVIDENLISNKTGVILAHGKGHYDRKGIFIEHPFKVGDLVSFANCVPHRIPATDSNGNEQLCRLMNWGDIFYWLE